MESQNFIFNKNENKFYLPGKEKVSYEDLFKTLKIDEEFQIFKIGDKNIKFSKNSKFIRFKGNNYDENIFICNKKQIIYILNLFKFKRYKIKNKDNYTDNIILNDDLDFDEIIYLENLLKKEDFDKVKIIISNNSRVPLDMLSLSFYDYQKNRFSRINGEFEMTNEREEFFYKLKYLLKHTHFIPICGPKSIGKTITLLYFLKKYYLNGYFYINLSHCKKLFDKNEYEELYLCICKELYNCISFKEVNNFYRYVSEKNYKQIMEIVIDIIEYLDKNFPNEPFFFVIDQYKEKIDKKYKIIEQIKNKTNISDKFNVIVCSSINEFDFRNSIDKQKENPGNKFYLDFLFVNKLVKVNPQKIQNDFSQKEKDLLSELGNLYLYYHQILENKKYEEKDTTEIKNDIMSHIKTQIKKYFNEKDNTRIIDMIRGIHNIIEREQNFIDVYKKLKLIPFKFFNIIF